MALVLAACFVLIDAKKKQKRNLVEEYKKIKEQGGGPVQEQKDPNDPNQAHLSYGNNPVFTSSTLVFQLKSFATELCVSCFTEARTFFALVHERLGHDLTC